MTLNDVTTADARYLCYLCGAWTSYILCWRHCLFVGTPALPSKKS